AEGPYTGPVERVDDWVGAPTPQPVHRMPGVLREAAAARRTLKFVYFFGGRTVLRKPEPSDSGEFAKAIQVALGIGGQVFVPSDQYLVAPKQLEPSPQVGCVLITAIDMRPTLDDFIE